jgi:hypothetical protein
MADLTLVKVPHPVGTVSLDQLRSLAESTVDSITANLLRQSQPTGESAEREGCDVDAAGSRVRLSNDPAILFDELVKRGCSDGLPVLPSTRAAVDEMIAAAGMDKNVALGVIPPLNGVATIEKIAANAVMAGCLPAYFSLVIAAVKGVLKPGFNLDGVQTTTGNVAPVIVVNGPCRKSLEINCGANVLGQGWRANATIGRALRLIMTNIGGATPGLFDKSTVDQPAKYTFCFGENEEGSPWEPLHVGAWSRRGDKCGQRHRLQRRLQCRRYGEPDGQRVAEDICFDDDRRSGERRDDYGSDVRRMPGARGDLRGGGILESCHSPGAFRHGASAARKNLGGKPGVALEAATYVVQGWRGARSRRRGSPGRYLDRRRRRGGRKVGVYPGADGDAHADGGGGEGRAGVVECWSNG